jgi:hypothetical protein
LFAIHTYQGCQIRYNTPKWGKIYQMTTKCTKLQQNVPNGHIKYTI